MGVVAIGSSVCYPMAREGCAFVELLLRTTGDDGLFLGSDVRRAMRLWGGGDEERSYDFDCE
jgi:hypothetical protein